MTRFALGCAALLILGACDDDGDDSETTVAGTGASSTTDDMPATSTGTTGGAAEGSSSSGGVAEASTSSGGVAEASTSTGSGGGESTGDPNACDPQVPGEWNACVDENGSVDNTLCNWTGLSGPSGFIGCLNSSATEGANVCMISGCEDVCDCFAAPATGDAVVECAEVLEGGGRACVLNCSNGETCPDGMNCESGLCFHPPA